MGVNVPLGFASLGLGGILLNVLLVGEIQKFVFFVLNARLLILVAFSLFKRT